MTFKFVKMNSYKWCIYTLCVLVHFNWSCASDDSAWWWLICYHLHGAWVCTIHTHPCMDVYMAALYCITLFSDPWLWIVIVARGKKTLFSLCLLHWWLQVLQGHVHAYVNSCVISAVTFRVIASCASITCTWTLPIGLLVYVNYVRGWNDTIVSLKGPRECYKLRRFCW